MTNFERITKSKEDMAKFLVRVMDCTFCPNHKECYNRPVDQLNDPLKKFVLELLITG